MRCPVLNELPPPPAGKKGWPWTVESNGIRKGSITDIDWPSISIVTPSLNQGRYIEETIRSVLLQGYPNFEYIIIDGGSNDGSIEIIKNYEKWLTYWVSEPDCGQSHAINKGFSLASGEIYGYINSDDVYEPDSFKVVATEFINGKNSFFVAGQCLVVENDVVKRLFKPFWPNNISYFIKRTYSSTFAQPSTFWDRKMYSKAGGFDESLHFCFDREFFLKLGLLGIRPLLINETLSRFREHANSKTILNSVKFHLESISILEKYSRACGIPDWEKAKWRKRIENEINYSEVFTSWKNEGRTKAIKIFLNMILKTPSLILERKILGQARRLFTFREKDVKELIEVQS